MKLVCVLALPLLAICSITAQAASTPTTAQLEAHLWQLARATDAQGRRIDAMFVSGRPPYTLRFQPGYMSQLNLCNYASSQYRVQDNRLILENGVITSAACLLVQVTEQERRAGMLVSAQSAPTLALDDNGSLVLHNVQGDMLVFTPAPLPEK